VLTHTIIHLKVNNWFGNKRIRYKRKCLEEEASKGQPKRSKRGTTRAPKKPNKNTHAMETDEVEESPERYLAGEELGGEKRVVGRKSQRESNVGAGGVRGAKRGRRRKGASPAKHEDEEVGEEEEGEDEEVMQEAARRSAMVLRAVVEEEVEEQQKGEVLAHHPHPLPHHPQQQHMHMHPPHPHAQPHPQHMMASPYGYYYETM